MTSETLVISTARRSAIKRLLVSSWFWLAVLAGQFALVQLLTGVQYGDAPRNLHWGILTAENPRFLIGDPDLYGRTKGFVPDPPELAPLGRAEARAGSFHPWWGPVPMGLLAVVWALTHSREVLMLVVPLAAGGVVLTCYTVGNWLFDRRSGLLTAAFVALNPLFYQHAVLSYSEALSALFLLLAVLAYLRGQTGLTVLLGTLTLLCKMDMLLVYGGVVVCSLLYRLRYQRRRVDIEHSVLSLVVPVLVLMVWQWVRTGNAVPAGSGRGVSWGMMQLLALDMLQRLFFIPWYGAVLTLVVIGVCLRRGLQSPRLTGDQRVVLGAWIGGGMVVLLVYMATPGASNSPRVIIPSLPAVALLVVEGWQHLPRVWMRRVGMYLGALFLVTSSLVVYFISLYVPNMQAQAALWETMRGQPQGFVLTPDPWLMVWEARQPATWFEGDEQFQEHILHSRANFERYVTQNPIRYVVVPRAALAPVIAHAPFVVKVEDLYGADVLSYLVEHAERIDVPPYYDVFVLDRQVDRAGLKPAPPSLRFCPDCTDGQV